MDAPTAAKLAEAQAGMSSRFESQSTIDEAKSNREKEWKEAYARIGQEPPKPEDDEPYDGRTLYEKLQTQKALKTEEWDSKMKLSNQYRGLQSEELQFLAERAKERKTAERKRQEEENAEVREYREAQAMKNAGMIAASEASSSAPTPAPPPPKKVPPKAVKKDVRSLLKGVVVKKKPKPAENATGEEPKMALSIPVQAVAAGTKREAEDGEDSAEGKKPKTNGS